MISVQEFQQRTEQMHAANVARIKQLIEDGQGKCDTATTPENLVYWRGYVDGLTRTLRVLDGHG